MMNTRSLRLLDGELVPFPADLAPLVVGEQGNAVLVARPRGRVQRINTHDHEALRRPDTYRVGPWGVMAGRDHTPPTECVLPATGPVHFTIPQTGAREVLECPSCACTERLAFAWFPRAPWHTARALCPCEWTWSPLVASSVAQTYNGNPVVSALPGHTQGTAVGWEGSLNLAQV